MRREASYSMIGKPRTEGITEGRCTKRIIFSIMKTIPAEPILQLHLFY